MIFKYLTHTQHTQIDPCVHRDGGHHKEASQPRTRARNWFLAFEKLLSAGCGKEHWTELASISSPGLHFVDKREQTERDNLFRCNTEDSKLAPRKKLTDVGKRSRKECAKVRLNP